MLSVLWYPFAPMAGPATDHFTFKVRHLSYDKYSRHIAIAQYRSTTMFVV